MEVIDLPQQGWPRRRSKQGPGEHTIKRAVEARLRGWSLCDVVAGVRFAHFPRDESALI